MAGVALEVCRTVRIRHKGSKHYYPCYYWFVSVINTVGRALDGKGGGARVGKGALHPHIYYTYPQRLWPRTAPNS